MTKPPEHTTHPAGAAFAVAAAEGMTLRESVRFGAAAGALAVTVPGAQAAMPGRADVETLLTAAKP